MNWFLYLTLFYLSTSAICAGTARADKVQVSKLDMKNSKRRDLATSRIDVVFQFDQSGSMSTVHTVVENLVGWIFNQLNVLTGGNFRCGLVGYGSATTIPERLSVLTNNQANFLAALNLLKTNGGTEPGYDAIYQTATETLPEGTLGINPSAGFCGILIGDEPSNGDTNTLAAVITAMINNNGVQFVIQEDSSGIPSYAPIAAATRGKTYDIATFNTESNAQIVLNDVIASCLAIVAKPAPSPTMLKGKSKSKAPKKQESKKVKKNKEKKKAKRV